jgi:hypothetical protein
MRGRAGIRRCAALPAFLIALMASSAVALGPHELALVVNENSPRSLEVANHYAHLRRIPDQNIIHVRLPPQVLAPEARLSRADFTTLIWEPVQRTIRERQLQDHILAWAYSADFPVILENDPPVSLTGITLVRNQLPEAEAIRGGRYVSPLFAGPGQRSPDKSPPRSLEQFTIHLATNMPLPSMVLGHAGARGETLSDITERLRLTALADGTAPQGQVCFLVSDDIRSTCRSWQYPAAVEELKALGVNASVASNPPGRPHRLIGLMMGAQRPAVASMGELVAGSMAEHLTSFGGVFGTWDQTKMTAWLRAGAAGSAGTVTEPMAIWTKFPHARFFVHYASGCSLLESFSQALASPLQTLLIGDPLARPWARQPGITLVDLSESKGPLAGPVEFLASTWTSPFEAPPMTLFLVDGRSAVSSTEQPLLRLDTRTLGDGYHEVRAVAYTRGLVRQQGMDQHGFLTRNHGQGVTLSGLSEQQSIDLHHPLTLQVAAEGTPAEIGLVSRQRTIARQPWTASGSVQLDPRRLGLGPNRIQAAAWYATNAPPVLGAPVGIQVGRLNRAPLVTALAITTNATGLRILPQAEDPEGDRVRIDWLLPLAADATDWTTTGGNLETTTDGFALRATDAYAVSVGPDAGTPDIRDVLAELQVNPDETAEDGHVSGLVFGYRDPANFSFFAWRAFRGAWVLGAYENGMIVREVSWTSTIKPATWHRLRVQREGNSDITAWLDDEQILRQGGLAWEGLAGLVARKSELRSRGFYRAVDVPPGAVAAGDAIQFGADGLPPGGLAVRARDPWTANLRPVGVPTAQ